MPSSTPFNKRFERYLRDDFLEGNVHWFSLINSVMMVLFLTAMVLAVRWEAEWRSTSDC